MENSERSCRPTRPKGRLHTVLPLAVLAAIELAVAVLATALLAHGRTRLLLFAVWGGIALLAAAVLARRLWSRAAPDLPVAASRAPETTPVPIRRAPVSPAAAATRLAPQGEPAPPAILLAGLVRSFGPLCAVDGLSLTVQRGEVYGFLGPNGAGKTTTLQMMVGLLTPQAGRVVIAGHDLGSEPLAARAAFGYVPDRPLLYDRLTGREFLGFLAQVRRLLGEDSRRRIAELLAEVDLAGAADRLCGTYSLGMKRKLSLAAALLHRPAVLLLDEPFNGLDPQAARRLKDLLARLAAEGAAVFLSTHDLATAQAICHRVGILHHGRLLAEGTAEEMQARAAGGAADLESAFLDLTAEWTAGAAGEAA